jgi:hypothetical protein
VNQIPILINAYNRPERLRQLIHSLKPTAPPLLLISIDGPKLFDEKDAGLVRETQSVISDITWKADIKTRFRNQNLGLKDAIADGVSWATSEFGWSINLEDDITCGPQLIEYLTQMLNQFKNTSEVAHVNGYNLVPSNLLSDVSHHSRITRFPESYAWATWHRAWIKYDCELDWALNCTIKDLAEKTGSVPSALRWKLNFHDAASGRINTWAYRWLGTIWSNDWKIIGPNRNLAKYCGWENGTHTLRRSKFSELPVEYLFFQGNFDISAFKYNVVSEKWIGKKVFGESLLGCFEGMFATIIMQIRKIIRTKSLIR